MKEITQDQINQWKKEHFAVYQISGSDGEKGYISFPKWISWKQAVTASQKGDSEFVEAILNNNWLGGDEALKENVSYFEDLKKQFDELIDFADKEIVRDGSHFKVILTPSNGDKGKTITVRLKPLSKDMINQAERLGERGKAYSIQEATLGLVWLKGEKEKFEKAVPDKNPYYYVPLVTAAQELYDKKVVTIKKC